MATGDTLLTLTASSNAPPDWLWVAFTSGGTNVPANGDVVHDNSTAAQAILEYVFLDTGSYAGGDAAGYLFLSNWNGTAFTSSGPIEFGADTPTDDATITGLPVGCYATLGVVGDTPALLFDDTVNEVAKFVGILPANYGGSGIDINLKLAADANTLDMSFAVMMRSYTNDVDNLLATSFNAWSTPVLNQAIDAPDVVGEMTYDTIALTDGAQMDSVAVGEIFELLIFRDARDGTNDDLSGDAQLIAVEIQET